MPFDVTLQSRSHRSKNNSASEVDDGRPDKDIDWEKSRSFPRSSSPLLYEAFVREDASSHYPTDEDVFVFKATCARRFVGYLARHITGATSASHIFKKCRYSIMKERKILRKEEKMAFFDTITVFTKDYGIRNFPNLSESFGDRSLA